MECEADEKIRRALRHQIRTSEEVFGDGDSAFYKRDGSTSGLVQEKLSFKMGKLFLYDTVEHMFEFLQTGLSKKLQIQGLDLLSLKERLETMNQPGIHHQMRSQRTL